MNLNKEMLVTTTRLSLETLASTDVQLNNDLKLLFVVVGRLELVTQGRLTSVETGEIALVNRGEMVSVKTSSDNSVLSLEIDTVQLEQFSAFFQLTQPLSPRYYPDVHHQLTKLLARLYLEQAECEKGYRYVIEGYIRLLLGVLVRGLPYNTKLTDEQQSPSPSERNEAIVDYLHRHYADKISLQSLADQFYMSKFYLAHRFKAERGLTIGNYIREIRLLKGIRLLEATTMPINAIAQAVGFSTARAFSDLFRERNGISPLAFRNRKLALAKETAAEIPRFVEQRLRGYLTSNEVDLVKQLPVDKHVKRLTVTNTQKHLSKQRFFVKLDVLQLNASIVSQLHRSGLRYVAVDNIVDNFIFVDDIKIDYQRIDQRLRELYAVGFIPYFQWQVSDWQSYQAAKVKMTFATMMEQFAYHLQRVHPLTAQWVFEFRCFNEQADSSALIQALVDSVRYFKPIGEVLLHFPRFPGQEEPQTATEKTIKVIDDFSAVRDLPYEAALRLISARSIIEKIAEMSNSHGQQLVLQQLRAADNDAYFAKLTELTMANYMIWYCFNHLQQQELYYLPVSLDGQPLYRDFPRELSRKMALAYPDGRLKLNTHTYTLLNKLFETVVYRDEQCIVTKKNDNYRMLFCHPDLNHMREVTGFKKASILTESAAFHHSYALTINEIKGSYHQTTETLSPLISERQKQLFQVAAGVSLTAEDVRSYNALRRPARKSEHLQLEGAYAFEVDLGLLTIAYLELNKLSD